jgi:hypothetical protein
MLAYLDFEKPLADLEAKVSELHQSDTLAGETLLTMPNIAVKEDDALFAALAPQFHGQEAAGKV